MDTTSISFRERLYRTIFESDTRAGRNFDIALVVLIVLSVMVVVLESVEAISKAFGGTLNTIEWIFTILFTVEYVARLYSARSAWRYATSFYGVVDLIAILPTYMALFFPEWNALIDVRLLRLLRVFRIFKLTLYVAEYTMMARAIAASRRKIMVFLFFVLLVTCIMGTLMYVVEGPKYGYTSIPTSVYWAITTMTTVGFGDITPKTDLGRFIASVMMLMGWGILAVPTGIVTTELAIQRQKEVKEDQSCPSCFATGLDAEDKFCKHCGHSLIEPPEPWQRTPPAQPPP